ncbi:MAG: glycoside hydrolase 43 family protein [Flavisolibacter sp.]
MGCNKNRTDQKLFLGLLFCFGLIMVQAQNGSDKNFVSKVWVADNNDGTYTNPVLNADYSDPDAIRVGNDFYLVSSSFEDIPGLPILHSTDLVNWTIIGHALQRQPPFDYYSLPRHGAGVWAPSIRYHKGEFFIYYPDPDFGIYLVKSKNPAGPWSQPILVLEGKGLIDPCPLWDDDGQVYLVHAFAGSRAGIKSILAIRKLNSEGTKALDNGVLIYDGHETDPTIEGPKIYKRHGWYYIFAPAGGVPTGWQLVLRSKNIYGPYERKVVMDQGSSPTNGPHQGAWVNTQTGEDWFLHFQDRGAYGRVVHLQPMKWINDWPVIGMDADGDGKGEPVLKFRKPDTGNKSFLQTPQDNDEFNENKLGLQWQWMANPQSAWYFMDPSKGILRLYSVLLPDSARNLWEAPNVLLQKFPAEEFMVTTRVGFHPNPKLQNERAGLIVMGFSYAGLVIRSRGDGNYLEYCRCMDADLGKKEKDSVLTRINQEWMYLRATIGKGALCSFSYSFDGKNFIPLPEQFTAETGRWIGAKIGVYCSRDTNTNDSGWMDADWFRFDTVKD